MPQYFSMDSVIVNKRGANRIRNGHLWVYRSDVAEPQGVAGGSVVAVLDPHANFIGQALFSGRSEITLRLLTHSEAPIDREWWRRRIRERSEERRVGKECR